MLEITQTTPLRTRVAHATLVLLVSFLCTEPALAGRSGYNQPPQISGAPATTATVGVAYAFQPYALDPAGRKLSFGVNNRPSWAAFNSSTGRLSGTPTVAATYSNVRIWVSDGRSRASLPAFAITVVPAAASAQPVNHPPTISGTPPASVTAGQAYDFTPTASDPDGQTLSFGIANRPSWATFSTTTGRLSGTPPSAGTFSNIAIAVSDGTANASLASFSIAVQAANSPPVISGTPVTSAIVGQPYSFKPTAQDADGNPLTFSIQSMPAWAAFDASSGTLYGTPTSSGTASNIVISVSDGKASASLPAFAITVAAASTSSVTVSWVPPTTNTDGTPLTGLSGFRVFYGTASGQYGQSLSVASADVTSVVVEGLSSGSTWYFATKAVSSSGVESGYSQEASKTIL